jgi:hypothetical protein
MPRKKSVKSAAARFVLQAESLEQYYEDVLGSDLRAQAQTWACEAAILKLAVYFEHLMLHALVGAINNDTATLSAKAGIDFPRHLTDEVCEYIVTGGRYFDFRGRDGLIRLLKQYVPKDHYLVQIVASPRYSTTLERLIALRNLAAHESGAGRKVAKAKVAAGIAVAGAWLKREERFLALTERLKELAEDLQHAAPY